MLQQSWVTVAPWIRQFQSAFTSRQLKNYAPTLATWGAFAGVTVVFLVEPIPIVRRDILSKLPVVGSYWENKVAASQQID